MSKLISITNNVAESLDELRQKRGNESTGVKASYSMVIKHLLKSYKKTKKQEEKHE